MQSFKIAKHVNNLLKSVYKVTPKEIIGLIKWTGSLINWAEKRETNEQSKTKLNVNNKPCQGVLAFCVGQIAKGKEIPILLTFFL